MATANQVAMEIRVARWIQPFCEGMIREVDAWAAKHPNKPVDHVFVLRCVQQFVVHFGVRVLP